MHLPGKGHRLGLGSECIAQIPRNGWLQQARVRTSTEVEDADGAGFGAYHEAAVVELERADDGALVLKRYALGFLLPQVAQVNSTIGSSYSARREQHRVPMVSIAPFLVHKHN